MKYIQVTRHVGGRTITQRYPARSVGVVLWDLPYCEPMACIGGCGYIVCSQTGPCAPAPVAPEPPADVLPDDEPYGCVNRTASSPRECVESGHYWCDAFKSKPPRGEP